MIIEPEKVREIASRVCATAESRTGGVCTWRYEEETQALFFRLKAEGKVVGAACSGVALADIVDGRIIEQDMVEVMLRKLEEEGARWLIR